MKKTFRIFGLVAIIGIIIAAIIASVSAKPSNSDKVWDTRMTKGDINAKNYFIVYSDLVCPYCVAFENAIIEHEEDFEKYLKENDILFEVRLSDFLYEYGEESNARNIVRNIIAAREKEPIKTTSELAELVSKSYPPKERYKHGNPAKKTFQAIRIEVNNELAGLQDFIYDLALRLKKGGRMCVITFHSLEDRIVKHAFIELEKDCVCDKKLPVCVCNKRREAIIITKKPILGEKEKEVNKRAESAKLRIIERV